MAMTPPMMAIPERMAHLPTQGGYPLPWVAKDFRHNDDERVRLCARRHLCGLCGGKLGADMRWFIGGPASTASGHYTDPWMHEGCARFAAVTCPFLSGKRPAYRNDDGSRDAGPGEMFLVGAHKVGVRHGFLFVAYKADVLEQIR
jgi:hypothetical protein